MKPFLLMLGDDGALLVPPCDGTAAPLFVAGHGEARPILDALAARPRVPVLILADVLAQEFRPVVLPRLNPFDRKKILARRLEQAFPQSPLKAAWPQKNRAALLACVHEGGPVETWLERLNQRPNPSGGVALLPGESASMLTSLAPQTAQGWGLLLSWQRTGGFRQIVTRDGELVFTRLTPPLPLTAAEDDIAAAIGRDIQASLGYLARLGLSGGERLSVVAVMPARVHAALTELNLPTCALTMLTPHQAARQLNLPYTPSAEDPTADLLHAVWMLHRRPRHILMQRETRQRRREASIRRWGWRSAAAVWLVTLALIAGQATGLWQDALAHRAKARDIAALQRQRAEEYAALAPVTEPLGRLRQAVARKRLFTTPPEAPWALFETLNATLPNSARATRLEWQTGKLDLNLRLTDAPAATLDEREALTPRFDALAATLRDALPGYEVAIVRYPFATAPNEPLTNASAQTRDDATANFVLRRVTP